MMRLWRARIWSIFVYPVAWLVRGLGLAVPWALVALIDNPPLWLGVLAGVFGIGVMSAIFVEGYVSIAYAEAGRVASDHLLRAVGWVAMWRSVLGIGLLLAPLGGIWSAAFEHHLHPDRVSAAATYSGLMLWQLADTVPLIDVPTAIRQPTPPIEEWGAWTGAAIVVLGAILLWATVLALTELVRNRNAAIGPASPIVLDLHSFRQVTKRMHPGVSKRRSLLVESLFVPMLFVAMIPFRIHPTSEYSIGMAVTGGLVTVALVGGPVALVLREWALAGVAVYCWTGAFLLQQDLKSRGVIPSDDL